MTRCSLDIPNLDLAGDSRYETFLTLSSGPPPKIFCHSLHLHSRIVLLGTTSKYFLLSHEQESLAAPISQQPAQFRPTGHITRALEDLRISPCTPYLRSQSLPDQKNNLCNIHPLLHPTTSLISPSGLVLIRGIWWIN